ncbi:MAG: tyrosine-type recombinase/integrase [Kamptonema sp. SIO1D9]|nr:tyrosine-type recombinase/integrase [Kamptonema sp. SIO1D9]
MQDCAKLSTSLDGEEDLIELLLSDKRSPQTRKAYEYDLKLFFRFISGADPTPQTVIAFLSATRFQANTAVTKFKAHLINRGLKEATINRKLAAIKSLVTIARRVGRCDYTIDVPSERLKKYRDTSGVSPSDYKRVLELCDRTTLKGKRDFALLVLLWSNALRKGEAIGCNVGDFNADAGTLRILGKGRGTQYETVDLSLKAVEAIRNWLRERRERDRNAPLFCSLDRSSPGHRLTGVAIYKIVVGYCNAAGIEKKMSPHRVRHSSITAALDASDGNVRKVRKLSRHANLDTLMIYDDNRHQDQLELSELLDGLI